MNGESKQPYANPEPPSSLLNGQNPPDEEFRAALLDAEDERIGSTLISKVYFFLHRGMGGGFNFLKYHQKRREKFLFEFLCTSGVSKEKYLLKT
jgi:hypothetical protein